MTEVERVAHPRKRIPHETSPDPLVLVPRTPDTASRKRKASQMFESPLTKRVLSSQNGHITASTTVDRLTPSTTRGTPTPRAKLQPYVELPPVPKEFTTPSQKSKGKMRADLYDDLGGFDPISEDDMARHRTMPSPSSARRATGDRDERSKPYNSAIGR